jgi:hydroxymethylbilane synthase
MANTLPTQLIFGTRASALAQQQTNWVASRLQSHWPGLACAVRIITTAGDQLRDRPLPEIGGKGLFTQALEEALRAGEIDVAVHSLKDLAVDPAAGLVVAAVPAREDARDVLVARNGLGLLTLPPGARVGTSSMRRRAQVLHGRPDLQVQSIRGNVDTRLRLVAAGEFDAILLAAAGVHRLGLAKAVTEYLPFELMLPAPGQAALAVQCRERDKKVLSIVRALGVHSPFVAGWR